MKVDLSIDWDFFVREKIEWDFGHRESLLFIRPAPLWLLRYAVLDLVDETDIRKYADFYPTDILKEFEQKGLKVNGAEMFVAESHVEILYAFGKRYPARYLISLDAHHDFNPVGDTVSCGNWARYFFERDYYEKMMFVFPKWKEYAKCEFGGKISHRILCYPSWKDFPKGDYEVKRIFLCRSGAWTPPHHDDEFVKLVLTLSSVCKETNVMWNYLGIDPLEPRQVDWDTVNALKKQMVEFRKNPSLGAGSG
jgi:hypothetical protein